MLTARASADAPAAPARSRLASSLLLVAVAAALVCVARLVAVQTIAIVEARRLLPRWDLATHLVHGWVDYDFLARGRLDRLLWDLWLQGYWPPMHSIYQVPFYLALGGGMSSGLWSSLAAFVLVGVVGSVILWRQWGAAALLPAGLFLALLMSSPYVLAYGSLAMTEIVGALAQLVVLLCHLRYRQQPGPREARWFAVSLTALFFTKYNYFLLLAAPLAVHEWLERTAGWSAGRRLGALWRWTRGVLGTPDGALVSLYVAGLLAVVFTGGFDIRLFGQRIAVHTIGNSGHVVLYLLLARLWYLHTRGRLGFDRLLSADPRVRPLVVWFVIPVMIWLASPYPNHIRDFVNLVINRPVGVPTVRAGIATYLDALRTAYFYSEWLLAAVAAIFIGAAVMYRRQPAIVQCLVLAVPLQFVTIALHQTRFPRFVLLPVVLLCLAACTEVGRWIAASSGRRLVAALVAPLPLALGVVAARQVVTEERFRVIAFEHYTDSPALAAALDSIRAELTAVDRLAIVGQSNDLPPALFRWELGPPSGGPCFPLEIVGTSRPELALATRIVLIAPAGSNVPALDETDGYRAARQAIEQESARGELAFRREIPVPDLRVALRLYERASPPGRPAPCR